MLDTTPVLFDYPNSRHNAFVMMRFQDTPQHHEILASIRSALRIYGVNGLRADDKSYADSLWANVKAYMHACDVGIAVFERIRNDEFNPNVSIELGYMMSQRKPVLLLKDANLHPLPSDIVGQLYRTFDSYSIGPSITPSIVDWLRDIGIAKSAAEKLLLFVSCGGTCRCAMAKIALERVLAGRQLPYQLRIMAIAHAFGDAQQASRGARRAVYETYGSDYLESHRVTRQCSGILEDADLILAMGDNLRVGLPPHKTFGFNQFFGQSGDVLNPWPDSEDEAAQARYATCMKHIKTVIDGSVDRIVDHLSSMPSAVGMPSQARR